MEECLSESEIARLMSGKVDAAFISAGLRHIEECAACRNAALQTEEFRRAAESIRARITAMSACLSYEQLAAYMADTLSEKDKSAVELHLSRCPDCTEDLEYLRQAESHAALRPHRVFSPDREVLSRRQIGYRVAVGFGLAAAVLAVVGLFLRAPTGTQSPVATVPSKPPSAVSRPSDSVAQTGQPTEKPPAAVRPHAPSPVLQDGRYLVDAAGAIRTRDSGRVLSLSPEIASAVKSKLSTGWASGQKPVLIARADVDALRGPDDMTGLEPTNLRPRRTSVLDTTPELSWNAGERIERFVAEVYTPDGEKVWEATVDARSCRPDAPLKRGETYLWRVGSMVGDELFYSKAVPFRVLSTEEADTVSYVATHFPDSHFIKGTAFERCGLYEEAMAEFQALAKQNPESQLARRMATSLERALEEARK
jgi:hypothetical protein